MDVIVEHANESTAVMRLTGEINASNFMQVIGKARELYDKSTRNLVIDLSEVSSISSTGIVGIHKIALLYSGVAQDVEENENPDFTHVSNARKHVRLLNPQPDVDKSLEIAGMKLFFKIFNNLDDALQSF